MKKSLIIVSFLILISFAFSSAWAEEVKIGIIDLLKVVEMSDAGKKAKDEMVAKIEKAESEIRKEEEKLLKMKEQIESQAMMLSATALADK